MLLLILLDWKPSPSQSPDFCRSLLAVSHRPQATPTPYHSRYVKKAQKQFLTESQWAAEATSFGLANYMEALGRGISAFKKETNQ